MNRKKKFLVYALVLMVLAALVYFQVRAWRKFDWQKLLSDRPHWSYILAGTALVYADYFLRAVRWKILLRPVCKTTTTRLVAPTMIGFTALALLGRPGEFIRPYLIARKQNLSMASQVAVWTVERIFDMGAFALIMAVNVLVFASRLKQLPGFRESGNPKSFIEFQISGLVLLGLVGFVAYMAYAIRRNPARASQAAERLFSPISARLAQAICHRVQAFGEGLNTLQDWKAFVQVSTLSVVIWLVIGLAYVCVTHAYAHTRLVRMTLPSVLLLTAASVVGGVLQLPVVGGGSQLATIGTLRGVFHASPELATSCGIMLWLTTFMSVIPAGLLLAHFEHVSLTKLEEESTGEGEKLEQSTQQEPTDPMAPPKIKIKEDRSGPNEWIH
jgi:uncharacterized protein (TIRG00374 family)